MYGYQSNIGEIMSSETKYFCDRCGKKIKYAFSYGYFVSAYEGRQEMDLCKDCRKSFKKWLKSGKI